MKNITIYCFRNDLRLFDNTAFLKASLESDVLLPLFCHPDNQSIYKNIQRVGIHRQTFLRQALNQLKENLKSHNSDLLEVHGNICEQIKKISEVISATKIIFEKIISPEEQDEEISIRSLGIPVETFWQSSMIDLKELPFDLKNMPDIFTEFRKLIESKKIIVKAPTPLPEKLPPLPDKNIEFSSNTNFSTSLKYKHASFPYLENQFHGGEKNALAHLENYLLQKLPHTYKETRNQLFGVNFSTKFSPWLSLGSISARYIAFRIKEFEDQHGANESSYWIWFELLWRDYFRFIHFKFGKKLYSKNGLSNNNNLINHNDENFNKWVQGETGNDLIDAGMKELRFTGYLSNRMRQIVASYLIYDLSCDWRKGALWFESQLIDYDVYSNQGNWLYIAGLGTDPRGGRKFNTKKQNLEYDPNNTYKKMWLN